MTIRIVDSYVNRDDSDQYAVYVSAEIVSVKEDEESVQAENGDHEGIVEIGRDVEGVEVSVFIRQTEKGCKISLRSNDYVNVSDACMVFGGGGHPRAAGCTIPGTIEQVKDKVIKEVARLL